MAKSKDKCFNILSIDDEPAVLETLKLAARENNIKLTGVKSLESARKLINEGKSFQGFIFDVVCNIDNDQTSPSAGFIAEALKYANENLTGHPRAIITGYSDHYERLPAYHSGEKIINKADLPAINEMFQWFRREIENLRETQIKEKYSDIWEIFDKDLLSREIENELLKTLLQMNNHNLPTINDNLARIRRIFESIFIEISKRRDDIISVESLRGDKGALKVRDIIYNLKDTGLIKELSYKIWSISSDNGSHTPYQKPDYMPTKYTVQSLTYALLDILLWMKSILSKVSAVEGEEGSGRRPENNL